MRLGNDDDTAPTRVGFLDQGLRDGGHENCGWAGLEETLNLSPGMIEKGLHYQYIVSVSGICGLESSGGNRLYAKFIALFQSVDVSRHSPPA